MKVKLIFKSLLFLAVSNVTSAQDVCKIYYTHDAAGNRVLRKQNCESMNETQPGGQLGTFIPVLYRNPTPGPFSIDFNELLKHAEIHIYAIGGEYVGGTECMDCYRVNYNLAGQVPGTYLVVLNGIREDDPDVVEEFTLIKR